MGLEFALRVARGMRPDQPTGRAATSVLAQRIARTGHYFADVQSSQTQFRRRAVLEDGAGRERVFPATTYSVALECRKLRLPLINSSFRIMRLRLQMLSLSPSQSSASVRALGSIGTLAHCPVSSRICQKRAALFFMCARKQCCLAAESSVFWLLNS